MSQQRAAVKKRQDLTESPRSHLAYGIKSSPDLVHWEVFDFFGNLNFIEDFETSAEPENWLKQRTLNGAHFLSAEIAILKILQGFAGDFYGFFLCIEELRITEAKLTVQALVRDSENRAGLLAPNLRDG